MQKRRQIFLTDIIIEAAVPLLIIGLIWSTVVFAITISDVAYPGGGPMLKWVFFCYVMGAVMINRLAGYYRESDKAIAYSVVLVCVMAFFALQFSGKQGLFFGGQGGGAASLPLNLAIVVIIGVASYKIARESCFDITETVKEKTALQLKDEVRAQRDWYRRMALEEEEERERLEEEEKSEQAPDPEKERIPKKHPGIWIVYFSLFSMLVFAVGQRLLPKDDGDLYRYTFTCLAANLTCALALLSLITLSSVRQRSWQKRALVRPGVGWFWIMTGTAIIVAVVSLATLPPRPVPSYFGRRLAPDEFAELSEEEQEEPPQPSQSPTTWAGMNRQLEAEFEKEERDSARMAEEQAAGEKGEGNEETGQEPGKQGEDRKKGGWFSSTFGDSSGSGKGNGTGDSEKQGSSESEKQKGTQSGSTSRASAPRLPPSPTPPLEGLQTLGKIVFFLLCALAALWALTKLLKTLGRLNPLQKLASALRRFRENLKKKFGRAKMPRLSGKKLRVALQQQNLYMENPFRNQGLLSRMSREELVSYTYKAFENFSHIHGYTPAESQTAIEFVRSLPEEFREDEFSILVKLFMMAEYSDRPISDKNIKHLEQTWKKIET